MPRQQRLGDHQHCCGYLARNLPALRKFVLSDLSQGQGLAVASRDFYRRGAARQNSVGLPPLQLALAGVLLPPANVLLETGFKRYCILQGGWVVKF